jgi:type VI secretion system secreted protein Hcp
MAIEIFAIFTQLDGTAIVGESPVNLALPRSLGGGTLSQPLALDSLALEVENTTTIGSATGGAGSGKVKFNPLTVTRKVDAASPLLFRLGTSGSQLKQVEFIVTRAAGSGGQPFLTFTFTLVFLQNISWAATAGDDSVQETLTLEYGQIAMTVLNSRTNSPSSSAWNLVTNSPGA